MLTPSEEVTRTWIKKKGLLVKSRPRQSRFSFAVCLTIVFSIAFGFLGGFITAGFALNDNFSSVYENLLVELENTRRCVGREKEGSLSERAAIPLLDAPVTHASAQIPVKKPALQIQEQAIFSVFGHAVELLQKNDKKGGCAELNSIINIHQYNGKWKAKAKYLASKNCF